MCLEPLESRMLLSSNDASLEAPAAPAPVEVHLDVASNSGFSHNDTLLSGAQPRDLIYDPTRHQLLDIEPARIVRYDAKDGKLIDAIPLGLSLAGGDITPDGKFLYVSELGSHEVYKLDLDTSEYSRIVVSDWLGTPIDIAIGGDYAIVPQAVGLGGDNLRKISLADDSVGDVWWEDVGPYGPATASLAARSADYSYVSVASAYFDSSYVDNFLTGKSLRHDALISGLAVSRDGALHAIADSSGIWVFDSSFNLVKSLAFRGAGVAFDPQHDFLYIVDPATNWVQGYDTYSWDLLFSFVTEDIPQNGSDKIILTAGEDAEIFVGTPSGVRFLEIRSGISLGDQLVLTATVTPVSSSTLEPFGTVSFIDNVTGATLGSEMIDGISGNARLYLSSLGAGHPEISAKYEGDANFAPAESNKVSVDIQRAFSSVYMSRYSDDEAVVYASSNSQSDIPLSGTITVLEGDAVLASGALGEDGFRFHLALSEGAHTLTVKYSGDGNYLPASTQFQKSAPLATTTSILGPTTASYSTPVRFVITVRTASGALVNDGVVAVVYGGTAAVVNGQAAFDLLAEAGTHEIVAHYLGAEGFLSSESSAIQLQVSRKSTAVRLTTPSTFIAAGANVKLTARVDPGPVSGEIGGTVVFRDRQRTLGIASVFEDGTAKLVTALPKGTRTITARYSGTSNYQPSTSNSIVATVATYTTVDLMIVYTQKVLKFARSTAGLKRLINGSVSDTNVALLNSQIPLTIRLVHSEKVNYAESGKLGIDLKRLTSRSEGFLDSVHGLRNTYGADLVSLFVADGDLGGVGWELRSVHRRDNADLGFSVVLAQQAASPYYTLAHELGHNFGATHDAEHADGKGATSFSNGWRFIAAEEEVHDIMSYDPGITIPYFSNPRVKYEGVPTGNAATADSARTITITAPYVAAYRRGRKA